MTNPPVVYTLLLQEEKIAKLTKLNKALESAHRDLWDVNRRLREQIKKLEQQENELNKVNI